MSLSKNQKAFYWREWSAVRKAAPSADRHELHIQALGDDKSHLEFNNDDFDKVLAAFRAISQPSNLNAQLHALNGQRSRLLHGIRKLAGSIGAGPAYIDGILERMNAEGKLGSTDLEELQPAELTKVMVALRKQAHRIEREIIWGAILLRISQMTGFLLPLRRYQPRSVVEEPVEHPF